MQFDQQGAPENKFSILFKRLAGHILYFYTESIRHKMKVNSVLKKLKYHHSSIFWLVLVASL